MREAQLADAARVLEEAGVPALLGKGWAVARHYARPALRPYGDLDFFVAETDAERARTALRRRDPPLPVDLHSGFAELHDREPAALFARSSAAEVRGVGVKTFGPEDHLRLVVLHLLRHGASRCLWLCDVAALLEAAPPSFDWDLALAGSPRRARAFAAVAALAEGLLGARLGEAARQALRGHGLEEPPRWLEDSVLLQWGRGSSFRHPLADEPRAPLPLLRSLVNRWPNAVEASAGLDAPFDEGARWPYQLAFATVRAFRFARSR